jgi:N-methylhydantoinase A
VASAQITDLIREITVERGLDPRDFVLHSFGGSCGMFCSSFAEELQVKRVIIPYTASVNCAYGLVSADIVHEFNTTRSLSVDTSEEVVNEIFEPLEKEGSKCLSADGVDADSQTLEWAIDFRYRRQVHEVTTPVKVPTPLDETGFAEVVNSFEQLYEKKFGKGSALREAGIEMTRFRLTARGLLGRPTLPECELRGPSSEAAKIGTRPIFVESFGAMAEASIYDFEKLQPGNLITGPAVIHTPITTIVIQAEQVGRMDAFRNIILELVSSSPEEA